MFGDEREDLQSQKGGIIPRAIEAIFKQINILDSPKNSNIGVKSQEIFIEEEEKEKDEENSNNDCYDSGLDSDCSEDTNIGDIE